MFEVLVRELIIPILIFLLVRALLRGLFASRRAASRSTSGPRQAVQSGGVLKKDPVCGTYVSTDTAVTRTINGEVIYFCSEDCAARYRVPQG